MVRAASDPLFVTYPDNCSDEEAIMYLLEMEQPGCPLPSNVTKDVDPHSHSPENLPVGIWFLVSNLKENVDIQNGFWKPTGPPCRVLLEPPLSGWRTALEFFKGPDLQKTIWMMHEFKITRDGSKLDVNIKDSSVLCRVLQSSKLHKRPSTVDAENRTEQGSTSAHQEIDNFALDVFRHEIPPNNPAEDFLDIDCISRGDFLELCDLSFPVSPSSSSENSSCMTISSDECFDSLALLQDLEQENVPQEAKDTGRPENIVLEIASSSDENCSTAMDAASSSGHSSDPEGSKKGVGKRMKKLKKKYLCFMPFM